MYVLSGYQKSTGIAMPVSRFFGDSKSICMAKKMPEPDLSPRTFIKE
jgi:hypothetical protein